MPLMPPLTPGSVKQTVIKMAVTVAGTVEAFDQDARDGFTKGLADAVGVAPEVISLEVSAGSVVVDVTIVVDDASAASSLVDSLENVTSDASAFSSTVGWRAC